MDRGIEMENQKNHFIELLGGTEKKVTLNIEKKEEKREEKEEIIDLSKNELIRNLKKLKLGKVPGKDGIENEAWRCMAKEVDKVYWKLVNGI